MKKAKLASILMLSAAWVFGAATVTYVAAPEAAYAAKTDSKKVIKNKKIGAPLKAAQELMAKNDYAGALPKIKEAEAVAEKTPYEAYVINQFLSISYLKTGDYRSAAKAFEAILKSPEMPAEDLGQNLMVLTQLSYQLKDYSKATEYGNRYLTTVGPREDIQLMVGNAYYLQKNYKQASNILRNAIQTSEKAGKTPPKEWYDVLMSSEYELGNSDGVKNVLVEKLKNYPSAGDWSKVLDFAERRPAMSDRLSLDVYRLRLLTGGALGSADYMEMAQLAMQVALPGEAKSILDKGYAAGVLGKSTEKERQDRLMKMAKSQADADLKSLPQQEKSAMKLKTGDAEIKIGEAYGSYGQYDKAIEVIQRGIAKGGLKAPEEATLRLGQAQMYAGKKQEAINTLKSIKGDTNVAEIARLYAIYARQR